ncbi:zinc finger BED domain-containing protein RICESLEEPER 2-like [Humulus lupulus]|uniref:zinc finger BED domain-containing protein RICESLEEPER 2-like n=1 Tax=Humulus lupulus TaxID=3486 RepID=UPI002B413E74|nr:zinc finger BED domain-containing protein RICESLEEPER 2-like [Humulus lupulus]
MDNEENLEEMMGEWLEYAETNLSSSDGEEQAKERKKENTEKEDSEKEKGKEVERPEKKQRVGKKTSSMWDHYTMLPDCDPKKPGAACNYCGTNYAADTKLNGTSTLWAHVERKYKKCPSSDWVEHSKKQQSTMDRFTKKTTTCNEEEVTSSGLPLRFNQNDVRKVIDEYIIMNELSFRHVDGKGFQRFIKHFFPTFQFPSRFIVARDIYNAFLDQKKELKSILVKHRVLLTIDCWTSIQNISYLYLTAHWVDDNWKIQKIIINFIQVPSHKGDLVGKELINCLNEWGISSVFAVTVDNASSNYVTLRKLNGHLLDKDNTIPMNGEMFHMRWNSTYLMLESAIKFKKAFENLEADVNYTKYFDEERMDGPPTNLDWEKAVVFVNFLRRFYDLTNQFSGSLYVTSNLFLPDILKVQADLTTRVSNPDTLLGAMVVSMKEKYDKYWGRIEKLNMLTFIANILDPRYKLEVVNRGFKFVCTSSEAEKMIKLVTNTLAQLYAFYKQQQPSQSSQAQPSQSQSQPSQPVINSTTESFLQGQLQLSDDIEEDDLEYYLSDRREKLDPTFDIL